MAWCLVKHTDNFTFTFFFLQCYPRQIKVDPSVLKHHSMKMKT